MTDFFDETICDRGVAAPAGDRKKAEQSIMLIVIAGNEVDFGKQFVLENEEISLGREGGNDIVLHDEKISKVHCVISILKSGRGIERIDVRDQGTTNGTCINGEPAIRATLMAGDKIQIGDTVLLLSYNDEIEKEYHAKLFDFAARDALTGLYNKRYVLNELENHCRIARRNVRVFSIIMVDIDDFKQINDRYGHLCGDEYLKQIAGLFRRSLREQDIAGRVGGEEFLIILPETAIEGAFQLAVRIRKNVEAFVMHHRDFTVRTTISAGVCQFENAIHDVQEFLDLADRALYEAKKAEKNKVMQALFSGVAGKC